MAALFEYVPVDPEQCGGAALDFDLPAGITLEGERRCCKNCRTIIGTTPREPGKNFWSYGGFTAAELKPLNEEGVALLKTIADD